MFHVRRRFSSNLPFLPLLIPESRGVVVARVLLLSAAGFCQRFRLLRTADQSAPRGGGLQVSRSQQVNTGSSWIVGFKPHLTSRLPNNHRSLIQKRIRINHFSFSLILDIQRQNRMFLKYIRNRRSFVSGRRLQILWGGVLKFLTSFRILHSSRLILGDFCRR